MKGRRIAIVGAGPIGLEAALAARSRGHEVALYEAGDVGEHLRRFGHAVLFTPFSMSSTEAGRRLLRQTGADLPADDALLRASDLVDRYLVPLVHRSGLRDSIREHARVTDIAREGTTKARGIAVSGELGRRESPFVLRVERAEGDVRFETADVVLDASGVYGNPRATGPGGLAAIGEELLDRWMERHLPAILGDARARYAGQRVLLIGDGHSAATALTELDALSGGGRKGPGEREGLHVEWVHRDRGGARVFTEVPDDALPARRSLAERANGIARSARWLTRHPGATVLSYAKAAGGAAGAFRATLRLGSGRERVVPLDRVLALVGYRPDSAIHRELQVHLCYASEGPMSLAAAILAAGRADPGQAQDCLRQLSHGPETLRNPEPGFFIIGAKSYGRNPSFLLTIGHQQILDVLSLIEAEDPLRSVVPSTAR